MEKIKKFLAKKNNQTYLSITLVVLGIFIFFLFGGFSSKEESVPLDKSYPSATDTPLSEKIDLYENFSVIDGADNLNPEDEFSVDMAQIDLAEGNLEEKKQNLQQQYNQASSFSPDDYWSNVSANNTAIAEAEEKEKANQKEIENLRLQLLEQQLNPSTPETPLSTSSTSQEISPPLQEDEQKTTTQTEVSPVTSTNQVTSSLARRGGFFGSSPSQTEKKEKNTIKATVYGKQVVKSGQNLRLRLMEPMSVGGHIIPRLTVIVGRVEVGMDRVYVIVTNIEYNGSLMHINLKGYDIDGQEGLYLPGSLENDALKEVGAEMAAAVANSTSQAVSVYQSTPNAIEQIKTDLGRGLISGTGNYIAKKLAEIKVTIQDAHRLLLVIQQ